MNIACTEPAEDAYPSVGAAAMCQRCRPVYNCTNPVLTMSLSGPKTRGKMSPPWACNASKELEINEGDCELWLPRAVMYPLKTSAADVC